MNILKIPDDAKSDFAGAWIPLDTIDMIDVNCGTTFFTKKPYSEVVIARKTLLCDIVIECDNPGHAKCLRDFLGESLKVETKP